MGLRKKVTGRSNDLVMFSEKLLSRLESSSYVLFLENLQYIICTASLYSALFNRACRNGINLSFLSLSWNLQVPTRIDHHFHYLDFSHVESKRPNHISFQFHGDHKTYTFRYRTSAGLHS